jgi:peroxiredoxin
MNVLKPRMPVPDFTVPVAGGGTWALSDQSPENFTMLVFYRGLHCPVCATYMKELQRMKQDFADRGVIVFGVSSDTEERAQQANEEWVLPDLDIAYGLSVEDAQALGLHRSAGKGKTSIGIEEPAEFSEPGLFLVRPDQTLYWSNISTMPFARPHFREITGAIDFAVANDYPARGELV